MRSAKFVSLSFLLLMMSLLLLSLMPHSRIAYASQQSDSDADALGFEVDIYDLRQLKPSHCQVFLSNRQTLFNLPLVAYEDGLEELLQKNLRKEEIVALRRSAIPSYAKGMPFFHGLFSSDDGRIGVALPQALAQWSFFLGARTFGDFIRAIYIVLAHPSEFETMEWPQHHGFSLGSYLHEESNTDSSKQRFEYTKIFNSAFFNLNFVAVKAHFMALLRQYGIQFRDLEHEELELLLNAKLDEESRSHISYGIEVIGSQASYAYEFDLNNGPHIDSFAARLVNPETRRSYDIESVLYKPSVRRIEGRTALLGLLTMIKSSFVIGGTVRVLMPHEPSASDQ